MSNLPIVPGGLASDVQSLDSLKLQAKQAPDQALKKAAQQFEAVFMNMMMKSMREATPQDGMFENDQSRMFTSMLDQQLTTQNAASGRGIGLADIMVRQLSRTVGQPAPTVTPPAGSPLPVPSAASVAPAVPSAYSESTQQAFVQRLLPDALKASQATGIPAHLIIGQAALESGWGKRETRLPDGSNSFNLFNIKAGSSWNGKVAEAQTTEYHNGVSNKQTEKFRAYSSYAEAFQDYSRLLAGNSRYAGVVQQTDPRGFAQAMQQSGYATDPHYADKLVQVINKVAALAA